MNDIFTEILNKKSEFEEKSVIPAKKLILNKKDFKCLLRKMKSQNLLFSHIFPKNLKRITYENIESAPLSVMNMKLVIIKNVKGIKVE